jgi:DNA polymerase III subunit gamma/tau
VVRTVDGGTLLLSHESAPLAKRLNEQRNADVVEEALKDALGIGLKVRYEVGSPSDAGSTGASAAGTDVARDEEDSMLAEAGSDNSQTLRRDPEEAALELLQNELCARRIDGG